MVSPFRRGGNGAELSCSLTVMTGRAFAPRRPDCWPSSARSQSRGVGHLHRGAPTAGSALLAHSHRGVGRLHQGAPTSDPALLTHGHRRVGRLHRDALTAGPALLADSHDRSGVCTVVPQPLAQLCLLTVMTGWAFAPRCPDCWPRSVVCPRSPACCGR